MNIQVFHESDTSTLTYIVFDPQSRDAVVIDPVLDYDASASRTSTESLERLATFLVTHELRLHLVLETHTHADHLSGSQWLRERFGARVAIGADIRQVQQLFAGLFDVPYVATDGSQFEHLVADGDRLEAGTLRIEAVATPGHTPACVTYRVEDALFTGDALFMHDYGTGRCDFPGGSAEVLYESIMRLYAFPDETRVFPGHDYRPNGRAVAWETSIGLSKQHNPHLRALTSKEEFVALRTARDRSLPSPRLMHPSVEINIDAGRLPPARANGQRYLTVPIAEAPFLDVGHEFVAQRTEVMLVDVREPDEFTGELGHVAGAQLVPLATLDEVARPWSRDREILLVCKSGGRSTRAANALAKLGFRHLYNLRGGMLAWQAAGLPTER